MNKIESIRGLALGIIRKGDKILVSPGYDKCKNEYFYRPLGGGIEFGENSQEALKREFKEELNAELKECRLITVTENIFTYEGQKGHEICFIYEAQFTDSSLYEIEEFRILDSTIDGKAVWKDLAELHKAIVYPDGINKYL